VVQRLFRDAADGEVVIIPVDLSRHVQASAFEIIDMTAGEIPLYVELAGLVDDGEASTIAVAIKRGLALATDDRKARRVCAERNLPEPNRDRRSHQAVLRNQGARMCRRLHAPRQDPQPRQLPVPTQRPGPEMVERPRARRLQLRFLTAGGTTYPPR
jgi:hypothetical protein